MTDYKKYIDALRKCAKEHENDIIFTGHTVVTALCRDTADLLEELEQDSLTPKGVTVTDFADKCRECGKQKKGKWIIDDEEKGIIWHCHCSNCKKDPQDYIGGTENWWLVRLPDHCPKCGVEMESEQ